MKSYNIKELDNNLFYMKVDISYNVGFDYIKKINVMKINMENFKLLFSSDFKIKIPNFIDRMRISNIFSYNGDQYFSFCERNGFLHKVGIMEKNPQVSHYGCDRITRFSIYTHNKNDLVKLKLKMDIE